MGCVQCRNARVIVDLGYVPSSEDDYISPLPSPSPKNNYISSDFLNFKKNGMSCYFCDNNYGLLIRMNTCECNYFGHALCFKKWIYTNKFHCSICNKTFHNSNKRNILHLRELSFDTLEQSRLVAFRKHEINFLLTKN